MTWSYRMRGIVQRMTMEKQTMRTTLVKNTTSLANTARMVTFGAEQRDEGQVYSRPGRAW